MAKATLEERFWAKVDKGDSSGCWLWTASTRPNGYGQFGMGGRRGRVAYAHRVAYELLVGPIPEGRDLDHVKANGCTSKVCVKAIADEHGPAHLEPVTRLENLVRGETLIAEQLSRTTCRRGHLYTGRDRRGWRICRTCKNERRRRRRS